MNTIATAMTAGAAGALTTNVLHELTRRTASNAPRVDLLGMQALAKGCDLVGLAAPKGDALYRATLAGDLLSNGVYFAAVALAPSRSLAAGFLLGAAAGIGAVALPGPLRLSSEPTARTAATAVLTVLLYTAGGLAAGLLYERLRAIQEE
jgi:hypothetical protein